MFRCFIFFILVTQSLSAKTAWKCSGQIDDKSIPVNFSKEIFQFSFPEENNLFSISIKEKTSSFTYLNTSSNKKNKISHVISCSLDALNCNGSVETSYNGKISKRNLDSKPGTRSQFLYDGEQMFAEYRRLPDDITLSFRNLLLNAELTDVIIRCKK